MPWGLIVGVLQFYDFVLLVHFLGTSCTIASRYTQLLISLYYSFKKLQQLLVGAPWELCGLKP